MKNLLVTNGTKGTSIGALNRGEYAIVLANGTVSATVPSTGMYKYVVGLGGGKVIEGLWLNAENKKAQSQTYAPGSQKNVTIASVDIELFVSQEATIHIHTQPKTAFSGNDYQEFVATVPIASITQTADMVKASLLTELQTLVGDINTYFGTPVLNITPGTDSNSNHTLLGTKLEAVSTDFNFNVSFGGAAKGTVTVVDGITFGTKAQVVALEKEMAVTTFGYNPNFEAGDKAYGNVFLAEEILTASKKAGFDIIVITATASATDNMPLNPNGAKVEQWIAVPTTISVVY